MSSCSFSTLFIKTNSSCLILQSIEGLEIKTSMLFNLVFANNNILSCFFFFSLIIDLYCLIPAAIAQIFNPIAKFVISIGVPSKKPNAEIEIHPVIVEAKIRRFQYNLELYKPFCAFYSSIHFPLFL